MTDYPEVQERVDLDLIHEVLITNPRRIDLSALNSFEKSSLVSQIRSMRALEDIAYSLRILANRE